MRNLKRLSLAVSGFVVLLWGLAAKSPPAADRRDALPYFGVRSLACQGIYMSVIDNASRNPATVAVIIGLPVSTPVTVSAWTR